MAAIDRNIGRDYRQDPQRTTEELRESLDRGRSGQPGGLKPEEFSLRDLAEELVLDRSGEQCGREYLRAIDPRQDSAGPVQESGAGVDTSAFNNITGQIVYSRVLQAYQNEAFVATGMVPTVPTRFDGEKIPGMTRVGDSNEIVQPGMPYPAQGFGEDYIETPRTTKRGMIVPVTKEAVFFDRTGLILSRAGEVGEWMGVNKEKRILHAIIDGDTAFRYKWKGTTYATYVSSSGHGAVNLKASNELVDWTDVDNVEQLFADITDPATGEPILIGGKTVLVCPAKKFAANRVFDAKEIRYGDTDSATGTQTIANNPISGYTVKVSAQLYAQIQLVGDGSQSTVAAATAKLYWYCGDFGKAFNYMENWPITVTQAPQNSEAEFNNDIVARFKVSERGTPATIDPRYVVKSTG